MDQLLLNKAFMSKTGCLKLQCNEKTKSIYLHAGKKQTDNSWAWTKTKIGDDEAGHILNVLSGFVDKISFFHKFQNQTKRTWINKDDKGLLWVRIEETKKSLSPGEQQVFKILLERAIIACNAA